MQLHLKLIVLLVPLIVAPLVALGWFAYAQQRASVEQDALRQMGSLVDHIDRQFAAHMQAARADVILFAGSHSLARYLLVEDEGQRYQLLQPHILKAFASYQQANPEYAEIRVLLPNGYEDTRVSVMALPNVTEEEANTAYFRAIAESEANLTVQLVRSPDTGEHVMMLAKRVALVDPTIDPVLATPKPRGYLVVTMRLDFLRIQTSNESADGKYHLVFTDRSGQSIFGSDNSASHDPISDVIDAMGGSTAAHTMIKSTHHGVPFLFMSRLLHDNLYVHASIPESSLLASTRRIANFTLWLTAAACAVTAILLYALLRTLLLDPLVRLRQATREIANGNLETKIDIHRRDELGELARAFEEMAESLGSSHERIAHLAFHDSLTNLPNRRMFLELLEQAIGNAARNDEMVAVLFLDLDDFKRVNDSLGHDKGDELLREVADRLSKTLRSNDLISRCDPAVTPSTVARLGGDEFIVLLTAIGDPLNAAAVARRMLENITRPITLEAHELQLHASIGITTYPQDGKSPDALVKCADIAMYHAKDAGKDGYQFYTASMNTILVQRLAIESALRKALERNEFVLYYQPQVDVATGQIVAVEALIRWIRPEIGLVSPGIFIPIAEDTGLIIPIGNWVIREACRQNRAWQDEGLPSMPIAVNISNRQFSRPDLEESIRAALDDTGLEARYLDLEVTETSVMHKPERAAATLAALKALGAKISMDDFGTGYSSLGALKRLPIDCLKVDQSFVRDVTTNSEDAAITTAIIAMSRKLNLEVLAEGVEQEDQLRFLQANGCHRIQGFLISRPVSADEMRELIRTPPPCIANLAVGQSSERANG